MKRKLTVVVCLLMLTTVLAVGMGSAWLFQPMLHRRDRPLAELPNMASIRAEPSQNSDSLGDRQK